MVNYVRLQATAKRLIEENGRDVVLVRKNRTPLDSAKDWRGANPATENTTVGTVKAVIYPVNEKDVDGTLVRLGMQKAMVAYDSLDPAQDLTDIDAIRDGVYSYKVVRVSVLGPGPVTIAYEFYLER